MRHLLFILLAAMLLTSCAYERGEVKESPSDFIVIHGKTYKIMSIVPAKGANAIWIMYPKDSTDKQPEVINYNVRTGSGKHSRTYNQAVIKVD